MPLKTVAQISKDLQNKVYSSQEITQFYLDRITQFDDQLNGFITATPEAALEAAKRADETIASGKGSPLTGVPLAQKDIFCTRGIKTSCASRMLDNFIAPYDAHIIENFNQAGAVCLGKTNMDEFAMGSSNENSYYGSVKNPWHHDYVPGGSSGGSAAVVAAHLAPAATGTDTGGSIRQPAAFCGITGLKPTYGRVSRYGMIAFASSLDQAGPMAYSAEDCAYLLNIMAGFDKRDSTCIDKPVSDYTSSLNDSLENLKIGLPRQYFSSDLNPKMAEAVQNAAKVLESLGASIHEIDLPDTDLSVPVYYIVAPAECSSNLARYDGVRYGYRCENPSDLADLYSRTRAEGFGPEVKRRVMLGTYALSAGYYDAYYLKAQKIRRLISQGFQQAFTEVDVILAPVTPSPAFKLGEKAKDPISMYLSDLYTIAANLAGLPAMSAPAGFIDGLPVGMQLIGNYFQEHRLLNVAHRYQQETDWHQQVPEQYKE